MSEDLPRPTPAAAVVVLRGDSLLLIRRARPPSEGIWSFPGGSVEPGETVREAAVREALEETGIAVQIVDVADVVDVIVPATPEHPGFHYVITDFIAVPRSDAAPRPGDDAAEVRWVPLAEIDRYALTPAMRRVLDRALQHLAAADHRPPTTDDQRPTTNDQHFNTSTPQHPTPNTQYPTPNTHHPPPHHLTTSPPQTVHTVGEFPLIERLAQAVEASRSGPRRGRVLVGVGDDAAVLAPPRGSRLVATVDTLVEGIHFRRDWTGAEDLGWKALAVNVSDCGAMGAEPWAALVSLSLPPDLAVAWVEELYRGLTACAARYRCAIVGGDTVGSPGPIGIMVALLGTAAPSEIRLRSGARPGDRVCVTGTLGDAGAGLALLQAGYRADTAPQWQSLFRAHLRPEPPVAAARALAAIPEVTSLIDLSDGLASDLRHVCDRSGVGARVRAADIPICGEARSAAGTLGRDALEWALRGGEDYQLLFTVSPAAVAEVSGAVRDAGSSVGAVGVITQSGYIIEHADGRQEPLSPEAFSHFRPAE